MCLFQRREEKNGEEEEEEEEESRSYLWVEGHNFNDGTGKGNSWHPRLPLEEAVFGNLGQMPFPKGMLLKKTTGIASFRGCNSRSSRIPSLFPFLVNKRGHLRG